ncbi:TorD/DmsD family molecular chaperone [Natronorarus salvus]|uniref:TorD/DmsD family molecular chaperone n=1 Tax=Natronorarus salvus TaxID=3117733 RepID=UPI002F2661A1
MSRNTILGGPSNSTEKTTEPGRAIDEVTERAIEAGDTETAIHRATVYGLLAVGFERPGEDFEAALAEGAFSDALVESALALDPAVAERAEAVGEYLADRETLHKQWASLFGVEEGITVSPYELTYLPGPLMTNVRKLADIGGFYEAFGLSISSGKNDRKDHLCLLLEFLSILCEREAALREAGDDRGVAVVVGAQRTFVEDHIGRWYWRFTGEVSAHDDGFYAALTDLLAATVERDVETLDLEPNWVPDHPEVTEWNEDVFGDYGRDCGGCGVGGGFDQEAEMDLPYAPEDGPPSQPTRD